MNVIRRFEKHVGGRWLGITFHAKAIPNEMKAERPMKFCEAIKASSLGPITLTEELVSCPGALRSFGWGMVGDDQLVKKMVESNGVKKEIAEKLVKKAPCVHGRIAAITVGDYDSPDVMVSYAQPESAMRLIYEWQRSTGSTPDITLSSVMAACGWVAAGAYVNQKFCLSFGCPESRNACAIGNDRLIMGLPSALAQKINGPQPDKRAVSQYPP